MVSALLLALVVGTWNGNWFPSGRAEHRAHPDVEAATIAASGRMLAEGLAAVDPAGTNDIVLCLNEMRGPRSASNLVARIGRRGLRLVSITAYRRRDRFDMQQDAIATTLPVVEARWNGWKSDGSVVPPRGYAFAAVVIDPATTAHVYAVHLKSNYGARTAQAKALNRQKRTSAVAQLLAADRLASRGAEPPMIVAGDVNADKWSPEFAEERLFDLLTGAGFLNLLELLPANGRSTHPSKRWGDSALDYVFVRAFRPVGLPKTVPNDALSDHWAVFAAVAPEKGGR